MLCTPGFIWDQQGAAEYKRRATGEGATFRERKRTGVICAECGGTMPASSLRHHMERSHVIVMPQNRGVDVGGGGPEIYVVYFPRILKSVECPLEGCTARRTTQGGLGSPSCINTGS